MENVRLLTETDPSFFAMMNRPHEDIEQRTDDLDRIFTPARGLRVRQVLVATTSVEVEVGIYVDVDGVTVKESNAGVVQTIAVPAASGGQIRADLIYFNLTTGVAARVAGGEVPSATGFSSSLWPTLPSGLAGSIPLGILYVNDVPADFDETLSGNVAGQIIDVRPAIGANRSLFDSTAPLKDVSGGSAGNSVKLSRSNHAHILNTDAVAPETLDSVKAAASGSSTVYSKRDHVHPISIEVAPANILKDASGGSAGSSSKLAKSDHAHNLNVDAVNPTPVSPGGVPAVGTSSAYARRDHAHPMDDDLVMRSMRFQAGNSQAFRIHWGAVDGATGNIQEAGNGGWSSIRGGLGAYTITFSPAFDTTPVFLGTVEVLTIDTAHGLCIHTLTASQAKVFVYNVGGSSDGQARDKDFHFVVFGEITPA
jgi:hypothetical protein